MVKCIGLHVLRVAYSGPALGMFEVFGRTGPQTLWRGGAILEEPECCNQMRLASIQCSKMRLWRLRLCAGPRWESLQRSPDPLAGFKGAASRRERGGRGKGKAGERQGGRGREGMEG